VRRKRKVLRVTKARATVKVVRGKNRRQLQPLQPGLAHQMTKRTRMKIRYKLTPGNML